MTLILELEEELEALGEINRLTQLDDGSGIVKPQLILYPDSLDDDAYDMPYLRIAGQTLPGEVLTGLGEDERVTEALRRNIQDSVVLPEMSEEETLQTRATQVMVVRLLCIITRVEAVRLRDVVARQYLVSQIPPVVRVALTLTVDILDAARLDTHPDDVVRMVLGYANRMLWPADDDLDAYFAELGMIMQQCEKGLEFGRFRKPGAARFG